MTEGSERPPLDGGETADGPGTEAVQDLAEGSGSTTNEAQRHWLTNDGLAYLLSLSVVGLSYGASAGRLDLQTLPQLWMQVFLAAFGISVAWAFGHGAVEAWRGGDDGD